MASELSSKAKPMKILDITPRSIGRSNSGWQWILAGCIRSWALLGCIAALAACDMAGPSTRTLSIIVSVELAKGESDGAPRPAPPEKIELSVDDKVRLNLVPKSEGHLYAFVQGTSGEFIRLFPRVGAETPSSAVEGGKTVALPSKTGDLVVDDVSGVERISVVYSANKVVPLETLLLDEDHDQEDIEAALRELRAALPSDYVLKTQVESERTQYSVAVPKADGYLLAEIKMPHH